MLGLYIVLGLDFYKGKLYSARFPFHLDMTNYVYSFRHVYPVCNLVRMCVTSHIMCGPVNGYNYRGNFRKNGPINDDDSRQSQKCGVCVDIKGHRLHATGGTPNNHRRQQIYQTATTIGTIDSERSV